MNEKIIAAISKYSGTPISEINENTSLLTDLRMESMNFIDMVCEFEEQFRCQIPERDFRKFITVKKAIAYLSNIGSDTPDAPSDESEPDIIGFTKSHCLVSPLTRRLADKVPELVMSVYGTGYPAVYLYKPEELWEKAENGEIYPYIAFNGEGKVTGMISLIRLSGNPNAFELGQLMVNPEYRGTDLAELLISCISNQELKFGVIYSESVTSHKFSQRSCITGGFCDTALKLNIMPSFSGGGEREQTASERVSCVVSCIERGETELWAYLPKLYKEAIELSFEGLLPRIHRNASDTPPNNPTVYTINDDELTTSQYVIASFTEVGSDYANVAEKLDEYANQNNVLSLAVNIPLSCPHNGAIVNTLHSKGFVFGGVMPRWYPESDTLLMQKLYLNQLDWSSMKLFSDKIQKIAEVIKTDK